MTSTSRNTCGPGSFVPRSGCGAAVVGDPDQVAKLHAKLDLGIESLILLGYPHLEECDLVATNVLPNL